MAAVLVSLISSCGLCALLPGKGLSPNRKSCASDKGLLVLLFPSPGVGLLCSEIEQTTWGQLRVLSVKATQKLV